MKIQYTTPINNGYKATITDNKKVENKNKQSVEIPIINNSISEAIGRSQVVSFSGENKMKGPVFEHSCSELFGDKESIQYNKEDGSFSHTVVARDGSLKKQEEFFPREGKEIITRVSDGIKSITTKTPYSRVIEHYNEDGDQIYFEESTSAGKKVVITDFDKGRRIISKEVNGRKTVQVIDLKTNSSVTAGDLVLQRVYDRKTDSYITENLITGQILKREKYRPNGKYDSIVEYSEKTGNVTREYLYDSKTGGYSDISYYETGARKSLVRISRDGRKEDNYTFERDGKTISSHVLIEMDKRGALECETVYIPGTDLIDNQTLYDDESCTKYLFRRTPNVPQFAEHYEDGTLVEEIRFQRDGQSYEYSKQYKPDGSSRENFFNRYGYKTHSKSYTPDNILYQYAEYNPDTDQVVKSIDIDVYTGTRKETLYDEETGYAKKITFKDRNGHTKEVRNFFLGTNRLKSKIEYNSDGSFFYTKYDESGAVIGREEYNADGTKKKNNYYRNYSENQGYEYNSYSRNTEYTSKQTSTLSEEEVIDHLLDVTSSSHKSISEITSQEWDKFAEIVGLESSQELLNIDKDTYRKLSKKFHPDLQRDEAMKAYGEKIFKVIQNLYTLKSAQG